MIVILKKGISVQEKDKVAEYLKSSGFMVREIVGENDTVLGAVGSAHIDPRTVELLPGVSSVVPISKPYKLASRELKSEDTIVKVGSVSIGGNRVCTIAGPCAVESAEQIMGIAKIVREAGATILRGGAFKPRTSPYSFQGLGEEGLKHLKAAGDAYGMPIVSEIVSPLDVDMMAKYVDMFQIGARNMQNFELLKAVGRTGMPVLLKRGMSATIEEWLMAAEYLMSSGTDKVVLCERGIRTYEKATRNTLDCSAIAVVKKLSHLPVIGDPSHATGLRDMVSPMALSLVAAGANGLEIEVHDHPEKAMSDGPQSLLPNQFEKLMRDIEALCPVLGRTLEKSPRIIPQSIKEKSSDSLEASSSDLVVAFQGERGAFSELATRRAFSEDVKVLPCHSFADAFDAVSSGKAKYAVIPVENALGGTVSDPLDLIKIHTELKVVGETQVRVVHNLISFPGTKLEEIKKVYSHPQALAQCREFLEREMPWAEAIPCFDTAGSVRMVKESGDHTQAGIAGSPAALYHEMEILKQGIETNPSNYTRFYVLTREENNDDYVVSRKKEKATFPFSVSDEPGSLMKVLEIFYERGLNMQKLESRPIPGKPWEYTFFVDVHVPNMEDFDETVRLIKEATASFRVLGVYENGIV
ncbi:MAG: 3-deoxy-7-phosphoheptulonate synthase [Spirochaetales bacterium]|nr:3-deoxy-7-phosphoheptulonate synthase [Candidatus Physcosoma equi]